MNKEKIFKLRFKLAQCMCKNEYKKYVRTLYKYVKVNFKIEDNICNDIQDIWDMLVNNSNQNINFEEVIPDKSQFIIDSFSQYSKVVKPKTFLYFIVFILIPLIIGLITFIQITYY